MASGKVAGSMVLLWQNPDQMASFAKQKISLDLSSYKAVLVSVVWGNFSGAGYYGMPTAFMVVPIGYNKAADNDLTASDDESDGQYWANIIVHDYGSNCKTFVSRGVRAFSDGVWFTVGKTASGANNLAAIPNKIFGMA